MKAFKGLKQGKQRHKSNKNFDLKLSENCLCFAFKTQETGNVNTTIVTNSIQQVKINLNKI